jgi:lipopolysaccharide biosynthesis protein
LFKYSNVCIERKNFGYDFGGYRDGILGIHKKIKFLERLLLVNDSTWFPLSEGNDWIDFVESSTLDFAGATSHYGLKRAKLSISKANSENYKFSSNRKNFHYASYALGFSKSILRNNEFLNFWKQLRLTGAKNIVVRRGEIGLTQWILKNKEYSHGSLIDSKNIENVLKTYSKKRLIKIARDLIIENKSLEYFKKINFNKLESYDSKNLIHYIMIILSRQIIIFSLAKFLIEDLNFPFLKKMILKLNEDSAIKAYESSQTLNQEISKDIEIEIKNENSLNTFLNLT